VHDLAFVVFLLVLLGFGFRRPFLFVLGYVYIDIVSPQRLSYYLLNSVPVSLIFFLAALIGWMLVDDKEGTRVAPRQLLLIVLLGWAAWTTAHADFPLPALAKWDWVWKSLVFSIFLPFTLRSRLRIEALLTFMVISVGSIIVVGGIKTAVSGGGYGALNLMIDDNSGLYEGSIISTVAIAILPVLVFLFRYSTIFPPEWKMRLYILALGFACLLMPVGTEARTGLICVGLFALLSLRDAKRRLLYMGCMAGLALVAIPLLPQNFTARMQTIQGYQGDASASTRIAVWKWTWGYVQDHPLGGGFEAYRQNKVTLNLKSTKDEGQGGEVAQQTQAFDQGRAFHSAYFEMLGEQGFPGLAMWLLIQIAGLVRMEVLRRRFRDAGGDRDWIAPLATALQHAQLIYLTGAAFVGIAFQPFIFMLLAAQIGLDGYCARVARPAVRPMGAPQLVAA
jgi:putative inorganic carbon (HCO3(-)) transporter